MLKIHDDVKLDYSDVLLVPKQSNIASREDVNLVLHRDYFGEVTPIIAANMDHVGTFDMARALSKYNMMTALVKHYTVKELINFYEDYPQVARFTFYSMGINEEDIAKLDVFLSSVINLGYELPGGICVDVANGYTRKFTESLSKIVDINKGRCRLMAGNIVTPEMVYRLADVGVKIIKVGIGPGSACSTRRETGIGYPQFSAVVECVQAADEVDVDICADGGITCPGDCVKAFAAGAGFVMVGGQFAGHDEGYTSEELMRNPESVPFYGMASKKAQQLHNGGLSNYRASEGKTFNVPRRGAISGTVAHFLGGIRSGMTYQGAFNIPALQRAPEFVRVNRQLNRVFDQYE